MPLAKRLWLRLWWMGKLFRAEKEPDPAKMGQLQHAVSDLLEDKKEIFTCRICSKPLQLETDTRTDEDGKAVHEECYVKRLTAQARARN
jgi:hypothetical protein